MGEVSAAAKWVARALLAVFGAALAFIVLLPSDGHRVLRLVAKLARVAERFGVPYDWAFAVIEFGSNIALFLPLGVLLPLAVASFRPWVLVGTVLLGALVSTGIELAQIGIPGRVSTPVDVLANTLGTLIGVLLLVLCVVIGKTRVGLAGRNPHV